MTLKITRETLMDGTVRARQQQYAASHPDMRWRTDDEMKRILDEILSQHEQGQDIWVFGYGSLIWNPAFHHIEQRPAVLHGWHRRFCLKMLIGRGTPETPGLMLALDHGGACKGVAFRIQAAKIREEMTLLWQREMYGGAYNARWVKLRAGSHEFSAVTFVINRTHPRYIRGLSDAQIASYISSGCGDLGTCREYLENTLAGLHRLGLDDAGLRRIAAAMPK